MKPKKFVILDVIWPVTIIYAVKTEYNLSIKRISYGVFTLSST